MIQHSILDNRTRGVLDDVVHVLSVGAVQDVQCDRQAYRQKPMHDWGYLERCNQEWIESLLVQQEDI